MEQRWERHHPLRQLDHPALERLVGAAFPGVRVLAAEPLAGGLRNTNYRVRLAGPAARDVVLRLYTADPAACRREAALAALVGGTVPVPPVLYAAPDADPPFAVTAWIEGMRLDDLLRARDPTNEGAATAAGEVLARIHSVTFPSAGFLGPDLTIREPLDLSDTGWAGHMEHFLVRGRAGAALGGDLTQRLRRFVAVHAPRLASLRGARTLVHADYKPWNLLLCRPDDLHRSAAQDTRSRRGVADGRRAGLGVRLRRPPAGGRGHLPTPPSDAPARVHPWLPRRVRSRGRAPTG